MTITNIPKLNMPVPHPKITARRITVEQDRDTALHAELLKRGWNMRAWVQFQDAEPNSAFELARELYELVRARGGTNGASVRFCTDINP
jgi:hypothetical protein